MHAPTADQVPPAQPETIRKSKGDAVLLGLLVGPIAWLHTYDRDKVKMWVGLVLEVLAWIGIIVMLVIAIASGDSSGYNAEEATARDVIDIIRTTTWQKWALLGAFAAPLLIRLVVAVDYLAKPPAWYARYPRRPRSQVVAILLAIFLAHIAWLYTYDKDRAKFWLAFSVSTVGSVFGILSELVTESSAGVALVGLELLFGLVVFGIYVWVIIDVAIRGSEWYRGYPYRH